MSDNRNLQLGPLIDLLRDQSTRRLDVKAGSGRMRAVGGHLVLDKTEPELTPGHRVIGVGSRGAADPAAARLEAPVGCR